MQPGIYSTNFKGKRIPLEYVTDQRRAEQIVLSLLNNGTGLIAIDTETEALPGYNRIPEAALSPHLSKVRLIQAYTGEGAFVFDQKYIDRPGVFTKLLEEKRYVGHNSIFDLQYFYKQFGVSKCNIGCTYLLAKLIIHATKPTDEGLSASLRNLVNIVFDEEILKEMQTSDWSVPELTFEQVEYSALDAICTYYLAEKLAPKMVKFGLQRIYQLYKDAQHPIAQMQLNGLKLNVDAHRDLIVNWRAELYAARKKLTEITGLTSITSHTLSDYLQKSLPSETLAIWPRTETGKLSTDAHVFADFDYLDIVKPFTEFQKREKLCTAFGNTLISQVNPVTNRLHASYRIAGARTGRLSCSNPNLQQLPRDNNIRKNFIPDNGNVFVCADYSQIEIRVGAELSRDATMLKAYKEGVDLHALTASLISHKEIRNVTKEDRQKAKAFNFGLMFGLGAKKFSHYAKKSYGANVTRKEAEDGVKTFRETYAGYYEWQKGQPDLAVRQGYVSTPCGKRRCLDRENSYGPSMNTPVQGGACECMLHALIRLNKYFTEHLSTAKIVNCVHDELLVEVPPADSDSASWAIEDAMRSGFTDVFPTGVTRGIVDIHRGKSWGEAKG